MTIAKTSRRIQYAGNGSVQAFSFPYRFFADSDLDVFITTDATGVQVQKTLTTDYTVSNNGDETGGTVTMVTPPASGETLTILGDIPLTQGTDYTDNDPFPATAHEAALDRLTLQVQELEEKLSRALKVQESDDISTLPSAVDRASKYAAYDASGNPIASSATPPTALVSTFMETLLDDTSILEAKSTLKIAPTSVIDHGAIGNGTTDDTAAFSSAGAGAYVPDGTYLVDTETVDVWKCQGPGIIKTATGQYIALDGGCLSDAASRLVQRHQFEPFMGFDNGTTDTQAFTQAQRTSQGVAYIDDGVSEKIYILQPVNSFPSFNATVYTAGDFVVGETYEIVTAGSTSFTAIGAADNNVGTRFVATGTGSGTGTAAGVELRRIVEYAYAEDGSTVNHSVITAADFNVHQGISAYHDGTNTWIYGQYETQPQKRDLDGGKGYSKIQWNGASTDAGDLTNYQLFGYAGSGHRFEEFYGASACVSSCGRYVVLVSSSDNQSALEDTSDWLFVYDRAAVEAAGDPLAVDPIHHGRLEIEGRHQRASAKQGVACDGKYVYIYRGFYLPLGHNCIQKYDLYGNLLKTVFVDGPRAAYGRAELENNTSSLGTPNSFEPEGITIKGSDLLIISMDYFREDGHIVSYLGHNFAARNSHTDTAPDDFAGDQNWVRTTKSTTDGAWVGVAVAGSFVTGKDYTIQDIGTTDFTLIGAASNTVGLSFTATGAGTGSGYATRNYAPGANYTKRSKQIYAIRPESGAAREEPLNAAINNAVSGASFASLANGVDFSFAQGTAVQYAYFSEATGQYTPVATMASSGYILDLYDARADSSRDRFGTIASRHEVLPEQRDVLEIRADQGIALGSAINLYGKDDSVNPNTFRFYAGEDFDQYFDFVEDATQPYLAPSAAADGTINFGSGSRRLDTIFAATGTINTSDARAKQDVSQLEDAERRVALRIKGLLRRYRLRDAVARKGDDARVHFGVVAQDVEAEFIAEGLDPTAYALFCHDQWEATPDIPGEQKGAPAGDRYGIRYDELYAFVLAAL